MKAYLKENIPVELMAFRKMLNNLHKVIYSYTQKYFNIQIYFFNTTSKTLFLLSVFLKVIVLMLSLK